ncbi:DUF317 domain-containing protein [Kitasatospora sp. NPDC057965]|uniref:DUF317 domain-containing protein n=1 Tax=Kitasatospora sp. NPDC057965 TaxID=3346291 RepID=UPI0036D7CC9D
MPHVAISRLANARWLMGDDPVANVYLASPDLRIRFGFLPETPGPLWKAVASRNPFHGTPAWLITMDDNTPAEIVADFATDLVAAHAEGPEHYLTDTYPTDLDDTLAAAGWRTVQDERLAHPLWQSPDGYAEVHHLPDDLDPDAELAGTKARWVITGGTDDERWWITASSATPTRLVSSLYSAVVNPAPVRRYGADLRTLPAQATVNPVAPVRGSSRALAAHAGSALIRSVHPATGPAPAAPVNLGGDVRAALSRR